MKKKDYIDIYLEKMDKNPEFQYELLSANILGEVFRIMDERNITKAELAEKLSVSRAYITKIFNGYTNFTLKSLGNLMAALDIDIDMKFKDKNSETRQITISVRNDEYEKFKGYKKVEPEENKHDEVKDESCASAA